MNARTLAAWDRRHGWNPDSPAGHRDPVTDDGEPTPDPDLRPVRCPQYCDGLRWHSAEHLQDRVVVHGASIGSGFLPAVYRAPDGPVTRENGGSWNVVVQSVENRLEVTVVPDAVVAVELDRRDGITNDLRLLPGEALQLAQVLTEAARRLTLGR